MLTIDELKEELDFFLEEGEVRYAEGLKSGNLSFIQIADFRLSFLHVTQIRRLILFLIQKARLRPPSKIFLQSAGRLSQTPVFVIRETQNTI